MKYVVLIIINKISALLSDPIETYPLQMKKIDFNSSLIDWLKENEEEIIASIKKVMKKS